jgi:O-acetyl-ADP-ribose deacetylase
MAQTTRIEITRGDITKLQVDAIVNAANNSLMGGGGVDGAIHRAGGPAILEACRHIVAKQGGCKTGEAVITTAGKLLARFVIHAVGPVWKGGSSGESEQLSSCYRNSLQLAVKHNCRTIAFPNISTGVYGFPKDRAAIIAVRAVKHFLADSDSIATVYFVCFDEDNFRLISQQLSISAK